MNAVSIQPTTRASLKSSPTGLFAWQAVPYVLFLMAAFSVFAVSADDPFITYRYAHNLLRGWGPVYNPGERVEGFSSPVYVLVSALLLKCLPGVEILFKAKLLGVALGLVALVQTRRLGRRCGLTEGEAVGAQVLVAVNLNFALAAVNGLETLLYTCLLLASARAFLDECRGRAGDRSAVWLFGALLARPDAVLLFVAGLVARVVWAWRRRQPWLRVLRWALAFLIPAVLLLLARVAYYGELLPNTYYAKDVDIRRGLSEGALYLLRPLSPIDVPMGRVFREWGSWPLKLQQTEGIVFWALALLGLWWLRRRTVGLVLGAFIAAVVVFVLRCGGEWMPGLRFLVPVLPLLAILQCFGFRTLVRGTHRSRWLPLPWGFAALLWAACAWGGLTYGVPHTSWRDAHFSTRSRDLLGAPGTGRDGPLARKWVVTAAYIQRTFAPTAYVAYSEMGYAGYINPDMRFLDVRGLTDREVARLPRRYKGTWGVDDETWFLPDDPMYGILARRRPDAIVAFSHQNTPTIVLGRYALTAVVGNPGEPPWRISPSLVYTSPDTPFRQAFTR